MSGVVFVNPASGADDDSREVRARFASHRILESKPQDFADKVAEAVREGVDFVAVAGGDGTIRTAAQVLRGTGVALLPVPAGTRNHFAKDLGIDSFERAAECIGGRRTEVDTGDVNGECFVNNSSIGLYPRMVVGREAREQHLPKGVANLVAVYEQLRRGRRLQIELDGERHRVWMAFIGNGRYGDGLLNLTGRATLDDNVLDVRLVKADRALARIRVVLAVMFGRLARSPVIRSTTARTLRLDLDRPQLEVALDGEVKTLAPPLIYRCQARSLVVLVPSTAPAPDGSSGSN
ncbi:MAG: diacylglycerol/lipid kinase family protein [Acidimicrobiales bacterium]